MIQDSDVRHTIYQLLDYVPDASVKMRNMLAELCEYVIDFVNTRINDFYMTLPAAIVDTLTGEYWYKMLSCVLYDYAKKSDGNDDDIRDVGVPAEIFVNYINSEVFGLVLLYFHDNFRDGMYKDFDIVCDKLGVNIIHSVKVGNLEVNVDEKLAIANANELIFQYIWRMLCVVYDICIHDNSIENILMVAYSKSFSVTKDIWDECTSRGYVDTDDFMFLVNSFFNIRLYLATYFDTKLLCYTMEGIDRHENTFVLDFFAYAYHFSLCTVPDHVNPLVHILKSLRLGKQYLEGV